MKKAVEIHLTTVEEKFSSPVDLLREDVYSTQKLNEGWAGEGTDKPSREAVQDALLFIDLLYCLLSDELNLPQIAPASGGEINFFWRTDSIYLDVGFYGDGNLHYYANQKDKGCKVSDIYSIQQTVVARKFNKSH